MPKTPVALGLPTERLPESDPLFAKTLAALPRPVYPPILLTRGERTPADQSAEVAYYQQEYTLRPTYAWSEGPLRLLAQASPNAVHRPDR